MFEITKDSVCLVSRASLTKFTQELFSDQDVIFIHQSIQEQFFQTEIKPCLNLVRKVLAVGWFDRGEGGRGQQSSDSSQCSHDWSSPFQGCFEPAYVGCYLSIVSFSFISHHHVLSDSQ